MKVEDLFIEVNKLENYTKKINLLNDKLKRLSYGSARIVYYYDTDKVVKLAKNKKGKIQNEVEWNLKDLNNEVLAKIFYIDDQHYWIIMEKAERINEKEFENITGLNFENFCYYLTYIRRKIDPRKYLNIGNKIDESIKIQMINDEFVKQLVSFIKSGDIDIKDLYKISSYGLVERNGIKKIVLIDYGITNDIYFKYYKIYEKRLLR